MNEARITSRTLLQKGEFRFVVYSKRRVLEMPLEAVNCEGGFSAGIFMGSRRYKRQSKQSHFGILVLHFISQLLAIALWKRRKRARFDCSQINQLSEAAVMSVSVGRMRYKALCRGKSRNSVYHKCAK